MDHGEAGVEVDALGLGASQMSLLFTSRGMEAKLEDFVEKGMPMLKAFRRVGDPSRDQQPLPPPRNLGPQRERDQARGLATPHGDVYCRFEIPQAHGERALRWDSQTGKYVGQVPGQDEGLDNGEGNGIGTTPDCYANSRWWPVAGSSPELEPGLVDLGVLGRHLRGMVVEVGVDHAGGSGSGHANGGDIGHAGGGVSRPSGGIELAGGKGTKGESLQLRFFSSLLGFFDFAENWYVGMLHNMSHKFHPCFPHVGRKNGPIEKCLTAFHKFHPCFTHVGPKNGHIEKCLAAFHMFHPCFSL